MPERERGGERDTQRGRERERGEGEGEREGGGRGREKRRKNLTRSNLGEIHIIIIDYSSLT